MSPRWHPLLVWLLDEPPARAVLPYDTRFVRPGWDALDETIYGGMPQVAHRAADESDEGTTPFACLVRGSFFLLSLPKEDD
jgi:hypothetical protein